MPYSNPEQQKAAQKRYYEQNKSKYAESTRDKRQTNRKYLIEVKTAAVCADCLIDYPHYVLQFDHVRGVKVADLSKLARDAGLDAVKEEVDKCEVVCSNCHAHRTWMRSKNNTRGASFT